MKFYVGVIIIVDHDDATYPPSVEQCLRPADSVPLRAALTEVYMLSKMFAGKKNLAFFSRYLRNQFALNLIVVESPSSNHTRLLPPLAPTGSPLLA